MTYLQAAKRNAPQMQTPTSMIRAGDGRFRMDSGDMSMIMDPNSRKTILLDHIKKEARIGPFDPPSPNLQVPGMPQPPQVPTVPTKPLNVEDLGKRYIDGLEVQGMRYTLPVPPDAPKPPAGQLPQNPISEIW